jgi:hypothetical protein
MESSWRRRSYLGERRRAKVEIIFKGVGFVIPNLWNIKERDKSLCVLPSIHEDY